MARVFPAMGDSVRLPAGSTVGQQRVLDALLRLDDQWLLAVHPRFGMDRPAFVVAHHAYGVCAIDLVDWEPGTHRQSASGSIEVRIDDTWERTAEAPRYSAHRYRNTIFEGFFASPTTPHGDFGLVRAVVLFTGLDTDEARRLQQVPQFSPPAEKRIEVWGRDALDHRLIEVLTGEARPRPQPVRQDNFDRLCRHLAAGNDTSDAGATLMLSAAAANIEANPNGARIRRVRGAAGSGKSLGLVARAARLARDGQEVLVVTYNPTLPGYLRDLAARRCREIGADIDLITFVHLEELCRRALDDAQLAGHSPARTAESDAVEAHELSVDLASDVYAHGIGQRFDAVLVDEGQDFTVKWWNFLRQQVRRPDGEMLLVADPTQDPYDRRTWTDEPQMPGAGFSGPWTDLAGSYRMPPDLIPVIASFAELHVNGAKTEATTPADHPLEGTGYTPTVRRWVNSRPGDVLGQQFGEEVVRLLRENADLSPSDIVFLAPSHKDGLVAADIVTRAGYPVNHVFGVGASEQTRRAGRFWSATPGVKGCTPQSFKGWESRAVVLSVDRNDYSHRLAYVGLTRVKGDLFRRAAFVTVINSDVHLRSFQSQFEAA
ncbi:MAG: hypothetical protein JWM34_1882 [Ilumatobacteraceae bacterium]|nr:hypothetical protein [Ilumatobacteraceae bacterium]